MDSASARALLVTQIRVPGDTLRVLASHEPAQFPIFLDSAAEGALARYSMLAFEPDAGILRDAHGRLTAHHVDIGPGGFIDNLDAWVRRESNARDVSKPLPFLGGWLVYLGYEMAAEVEPVLRLPEAGAPYSAFALRVSHLAVYDHAADAVYAVSQGGDAAKHARLISHLEHAASNPPPPLLENPRVDRWVEEAPEM